MHRDERAPEGPRGSGCCLARSFHRTRKPGILPHPGKNRASRRMAGHLDSELQRLASWRPGRGPPCARSHRTNHWVVAARQPQSRHRRQAGCGSGALPHHLAALRAPNAASWVHRRRTGRGSEIPRLHWPGVIPRCAVGLRAEALWAKSARRPSGEVHRPLGTTTSASCGPSSARRGPSNGLVGIKAEAENMLMLSPLNLVESTAETAPPARSGSR